MLQYLTIGSVKLKHLITFCFLLNCAAFFSQTTVTITTTGAGTWVAPCGVTSVTIQCWGGGGEGGAGNFSNKDGGGGGGGGAYTFSNAVTVVPSTSYNYTVGAGGSGCTGAATANNGIASTMIIGATTITANGGGGGRLAPSGLGGAGGTGTFNGGAGVTGVNGTRSGGGGEGASPAGDGNAGIGVNGGTGTAGGDGGGGRTTNNGPGFAGTAIGGGGGGGNGSGCGGIGGNGQLVISYYNCPVSTSAFQSSTQFVCVGSAATTLSTTVSDVCGVNVSSGLSYQWYYNTTNSNTVAGATLIAGATSLSYTPLSTITELGTRYYFCVGYSSSCSQTNATQSLASNVVQITVTNVPPTVASVGSNTTICVGSSANITANTPVVGSGSWSVLSGPSLALTQFANVSSPNTVFTPAGGPVTYTLRWTINNGGCKSTADMIVTVNCGGACPACTSYNHPIGFTAGEYAGTCETALCSGFYYDDGGSGSNYSINIGDGAGGGIYRVFCPNTAGQCLTATFTSFNVDASDNFRVGNGSTQNSAALFSGSGSAIPGPFTGTTNGCLSFRFYSNGSNVAAGWAAQFSCAPCAGAPTGLTNADCLNAALLCSNATITGLTVGPGVSAEACGGGVCPAGGENHSSWYAVTIKTSGTFLFSIVPVTGTDDFDYTVFGPNVSCSSLGSPVRCSDAYLAGTTGLSAAAVDLTEDVNGNKFTAQMNVLAGETYYIMVDSWTPPTTGYNLNFSGTAGISCTLLPNELLTFSAKYDLSNKVVNLDWKTMSETNSHYFEVQRSLDGDEFEKIDVVFAAGNSSVQKNYHIIDKNAVPEVMNYYRLKQFDLSGNFKYSKIEAIVYSDLNSKIQVEPNPTSNAADVIFNSASEGIYHINILDFTGKILVSKEIKINSGKNVIPLDLSKFANGVHFVTLQGGGDFLKTSFIKQ